MGSEEDWGATQGEFLTEREFARIAPALEEAGGSEVKRGATQAVVTVNGVCAHGRARTWQMPDRCP